MINTSSIKHEAGVPGPGVQAAQTCASALGPACQSQGSAYLPFPPCGCEEWKENETQSPDTVLSSTVSDDQSVRFYKPLHQISFIQREEQRKGGNAVDMSSIVCIHVLPDIPSVHFKGQQSQEVKLLISAGKCGNEKLVVERASGADLEGGKKTSYKTTI